MNILFLTQVSGILKPFAWIMGVILDAIYKFVGLFGIHNLALCIFLFTFVVKMLMLPLTIKQQKFTRLSSKMNPELTKIQEKYKGKQDEASMRRQQAETQEVYAKYGTNPMGGCLPLLISLPIMFALYRVIYKMPSYINDVYSLYDVIVGAFQKSGVGDQTAAMNVLSNFINNFNVANGARGIVSQVGKYTFGSVDFKNYCIDVFAYFNQSNWDAFVNGTLIESDSWKEALANVKNNINAGTANVTFEAVKVGWAMLDVIRKLYPNDFKVSPPYKEGMNTMLELNTGCGYIKEGTYSLEEQFKIIDKDTKEFKKIRSKYLLY